MLKKVRKGYSFRASLSVFFLLQCSVCVLIFQGDVVWGGLEENKVLEKELKEKRLKLKHQGKTKSIV